jgi:hypothetical protein
VAAGELAVLLAVIARRIRRLLVRRGVSDEDDGTPAVDRSLYRRAFQFIRTLMGASPTSGGGIVTRNRLPSGATSQSVSEGGANSRFGVPGRLASPDGKSTDMMYPSGAS